MNSKRRKFLKMAGATVLAGMGAPALVKLHGTAQASADSGPAPAHAADSHGGGHGHGEEQNAGIRLGMVIDMRKFYDDEALLDDGHRRLPSGA
jgi:hypothetical protein